MSLPFQLPIRAFALVAGVLLVGGGVAELASTTSCAATATNNPLRSFENAKNVDVVCMKTLAMEDGGGVLPQPLPQAACTPVPTNVTGAYLPNHLFALVTQTKRGEVAVVDLTAGVVIDEDLGLPGTNFLPVGQSPTGIASSLDGMMTYVTTAEPNKPAIYGLPSTMILGNSQQLEAGKSPTPPVLTTWPVCALPQAAGPITIIPNAPPEPSNEHSDAGPSTPANASGYVLAVVLPATQEGQHARVVTIDPLPLLRGGGVIATEKGAEVDPPGQLKPCTILGELPLSDTVREAGGGPNWADGVKWLDGGIEAALPTSATCSGGALEAGVVPPSLPNPAPQPVATARAGQFLYVADSALPLIHVFDLTSPTRPREIEPLRATSLAQPTRAITVGAIAISPPTREYRRFLYAVDASDSPASIMVFEITDPVGSPHVPLKRPHSALVPLEPQDRINFAAGVAALAFVQHDWPLAQTPSGALTSGAASTGLLCNPNPNADRGADGGVISNDASADAQQFSDPGANYRYSSLAFADEPLGPSRLRGIFAFATLSNGDVVTIDVDDWDAPCRRPSIMGPSDAGNGKLTNGYTSAIAPPEPDAGRRDSGLEQYEAPYTYSTNGVPWTSAEAFFPVSAPHRARSQFPLRNDPTLGIHFPYLVGAPQLYGPGPDGGLGASVTGSVAAGNPVMLPTRTTFPDPSDPPDGAGIRLAWEDPTAHVDQNWTVDYEGKLVSFQMIEADLDISSKVLPDEGPAYWTMTLSAPGGLLCSKGVEDWTIGQQRAAAFVNASKDAGVPAPEGIASWVADYLQVADDLLPPTDPYWSADPQANETNDCWAGFNGTNADGSTTPPLTDPTERYNTCETIFGFSGDEYVSRDFPIIKAYDDALVITRYNYPESGKFGDASFPVTPTTMNREVTVPDKTNVTALKQLACCFNHQMKAFNVRAGGEWLTTGSVSGYLHHMMADPVTNRCVTSCDPEKALLNSRTIGVASAASPSAEAGIVPPDRDSPLAMRNPIFGYFVAHPFVPNPNVSPQAPVDAGMVVARPARDFVWEFSLKGELTPLSVNLAATNSSVSPQSMLFIPSLGQLAIVDGSQNGQGLILIDLNTVAVTGTTYY